MNEADGFSLYGVLVATSLAGVLVIIVVLLHYEVLRLFSRTLARLPSIGKPRIALLIFGLLTTHIVEIWTFAVGFYFALHHFNIGTLAGKQYLSFIDCVYFSAVTFTTVGYGDLFPVGPVRFLAAVEALTGLMLVTWSASFTYLEMNRYWHHSR